MVAKTILQALLASEREQGRSEEYLAGIEAAIEALGSRSQKSSPEKRTAKNARGRLRRKRFNDQLIEKSMSRYKHYTYAEWLVIMDSTLTAREAALKIGRTYRGIETARLKLKRGYIPMEILRGRLNEHSTSPKSK